MTATPDLAAIEEAPRADPGRAPAAERRAAGLDRARAAPHRPDQQRRRAHDPVLPGPAGVPAHRADREPRLPRVLALLLRHRQRQPAGVLRLPRSRRRPLRRGARRPAPLAISVEPDAVGGPGRAAGGGRRGPRRAQRGLGLLPRPRRRPDRADRRPPRRDVRPPRALTREGSRLLCCGGVPLRVDARRSRGAVRPDPGARRPAAYEELSGGLTNRNLKVTTPDGCFVARCSDRDARRARHRPRRRVLQLGARPRRRGRGAGHRLPTRPRGAGDRLPRGHTLNTPTFARPGIVDRAAAGSASSTTGRASTATSTCSSASRATCDRQRHGFRMPGATSTTPTRSTAIQRALAVATQADRAVQQRPAGRQLRRRRRRRSG